MAAKAQRLNSADTDEGYSAKDMEAVDFPELTESELAGMRPAKDVLPTEFFRAMENHRESRGRPSLEKTKKQVTLRLDEDVIASFRAGGKGWQSRMNEALRKAAGM